MQNKLQKEYEYPSLCCVKIITEELESDNTCHELKLPVE